MTLKRAYSLGSNHGQASEQAAAPVTLDQMAMSELECMEKFTWLIGLHGCL